MFDLQEAGPQTDVTRSPAAPAQLVPGPTTARRQPQPPAGLRRRSRRGGRLGAGSARRGRCGTPRRARGTPPPSPGLPRGTPRRAAVAAVMVRRIPLVAPVAVSVRRSRAAALRIRPTVIARTHMATSAPSPVACQRTASRPVLRLSRLDEEAGFGRELARCGDLVWGERLLGLQQPPDPHRLPAVRGQRLRRDERAGQ